MIAGNGSTYIINYPISQASLGTNFRTHSLFFNDSWPLAATSLQPRRPVGQEPRRRCQRQPGRERQRVQPAARRRVGSKGRRSVERARELRQVRRGARKHDCRLGFAGRHAVNPRVVLPGSGNQHRERRTARGVGCGAEPGLQRFNAGGGTSRNPFFTSIPGVQTQIRDSLVSPHANEFATGLSRQLGGRGALRFDFVYRDFTDFYGDRIDLSTGQVTDEVGQVFDLALVEKTT